MLSSDTLQKKLGYDASPHYRLTNGVYEPETAHLFRSARNAGVKGIYVFETGPESSKQFFKPRPAVYVADAQDETQARHIHRQLWNLSYAPFVLIRLPNQIRVYTGFDYSAKKADTGLLDKAKHRSDLQRIISNLNADTIDSGRVWQNEYVHKLNPDKRVDKHLLNNLKKLGKALRAQSSLNDAVIHALIGKFVFFSYLRHRHILTDEWMAKQGIRPDSVFSQNATIAALKKLTEALEARFNGRLFPIDFEKENALDDQHVQWVAAVFSGGELTNPENAPDIVLQLHIPFKAYDFEYIPVETLSAIYEQFIFDRKLKGAVYTPEILADYLISEIETYQVLQPGMKILDPACGSGVFLVLIYRRLIEKEAVRVGRKLIPEELLAILQQSIFGVERERDACYVAGFSLILTLLHYLEPRDLENINFRFPVLHNRQIFACDFFDIKGKTGGAEFWQKKLVFDRIVGNPPWVEVKRSTKDAKFVSAWLQDRQNQSVRPVGGKRVAEAFAWIVTDCLKKDGLAGLILPATSLFNLESEKFRQAFFETHDVLEITNFANIRDKLFDKRGSLPAATFIYRPTEDKGNRPEIRHYAPYAVNQRALQNGKPWVIALNENEMKYLSPYQALNGETSFWKMALWGTPYDERILERIKAIFPISLSALCQKNDWVFKQSAEFRNINTRQNSDIDLLELVKEYKGSKRLRTDLMTSSRFRFSIPDSAFDIMTDEMCYLRKRGGRAGLKVFKAPHIILSAGWRYYIAYSEIDFLLPAFQFGISSPKDDSDHLKALSMYLNSDIAAYYLFFIVPQWGVFRQAKSTSITTIRKIPTPDLTAKQIKKLAGLHQEIVSTEKQEIKSLVAEIRKNGFDFDDSLQNRVPDEFAFPENLTKEEKNRLKKDLSELRSKLQQKIDATIYRLFKIPDDIRITVEDFFKTRLPLDTPSLLGSAIRKPTRPELKQYARTLRDELDDFVMGESFHRVTVTYSDELIESAIEMTASTQPHPVTKHSVVKGDLTTAGLMTELGDALKKQMSQWVYMQRSLRLFQGPKIYIYKTPRLIDWTRTQAIIDAGDIIGELIASQ
ncbi:N-6 DNA methylase [Desulfococcaceae bacterium HSG9]|nr:N-6 DNA methylase [Desulfococcaceae bacterium HSG9]